MRHKHLATPAVILGLSASLFGSRAALAHAFLDHAVPGVGATVAASPGELALTFTQEVETPLSSVHVTTAAGAAVPTAKPTGDGATLRVRLARPLAVGTYLVHWHVVSVDTHPTSGTYKFTVAP